MITTKKKRVRKTVVKKTAKQAKLRQQLNDLGKGYKALVRELAKR